MICAKIHVTLKPGVLDPQGSAIAQAIAALGYKGVSDVRQGKYFELTLADTPDAVADLHSICRKLLANPVIESYRLEIER